MLMQLIHNLGTRAEKKVDKKQFVALKKVRGTAKLLFRMAEQPDSVIKEAVSRCGTENTAVVSVWAGNQCWSETYRQPATRRQLRRITVYQTKIHPEGYPANGYFADC